MFWKNNALDEYIDADPTTYSKLTLPHIDRIHITRWKIYEIIEEEERDLEWEVWNPNKVFLEEYSNFEYVEIIQNEKEQKLISMILKWIISVWDIITKDDMYISSVINVWKIQMDNTLYDFNADMYLLDLLFFDSDHDIGMNMIWSKDYSKYYFFDFWINCFTKENTAFIKIKMDQNFNVLVNLLISCEQKGELLFSKSHFQESINMLKSRFMWDADWWYSFFMLLVEKSWINEDIWKKYWKIFINNLRNLEYCVDLLDEAWFWV